MCLISKIYKHDFLKVSYKIEFTRISGFIGHKSVAVLQTVKMLVIVVIGKKWNRGCLKLGNDSKPLRGITSNKL